MQLLEHYDPLNLPRGSVRSLVTLGLLGVLWALMVLDREIPPSLAYLVLLILGHYFGSRSTGQHAEGQKSPLGLPRGTIRVLIVAGFAAVGYQLWADGRLIRGTDPGIGVDLENRSVAILFLTGALFLGIMLRKCAQILVRGAMSKARRVLSNARAVLVLMAACLLGIASCMSSAEPLVANLSLAATLVVGFYFGSRP